MNTLKTVEINVNLFRQRDSGVSISLATKSDNSRLHQTVSTTKRIIGTIFALLPFGKRYRALSPKTSRNKNRSFPEAIHIYNRHLTATILFYSLLWNIMLKKYIMQTYIYTVPFSSYIYSSLFMIYVVYFWCKCSETLCVSTLDQWSFSGEMTNSYHIIQSNINYYLFCFTFFKSINFSSNFRILPPLSNKRTLMSWG